MQKFVITEADPGVSDFDVTLGEMWSDHCINPFNSIEIKSDQEVLLLGKDGEYRGKTTLDLLFNMGEEC
jgi:hypothetical protein